ncbi:hypothetical protein C5Y96_13290 [Blastopirellula marina]|uniref:DUF1559 domain-containing protein n=1 Tax=Blastopirellula marina TaxID=124 RepID=A0A2S8FGT9_9BACT|nr:MULTISPECIES: DUF1559 domain-containing protein [Pirellulaceae]PQO31310.1 hypothetical protein C5Y96_13290 [Blastopirellula marina]RCS51704.1 DUF1559 domain-containing protein [Bremerella cremea]
MRTSRRGDAKVVIIIVVVVFGVMALLCTGILVALLLPAVQQARMAAQRMQSNNNLKMIAIALHNYHDVYGTLPPAYIPDEDGEPMHSWRVLILPFVEGNDIYDKYDFSQPWDSPGNMQACERMPFAYASPALGGNDMGDATTYVAISGPNTMLGMDKARSFADVKVGISNVIMVVEDTTNPVPWYKPVDISPQALMSKNFDDQYFHGVQAAMGDGAVQFIPEGSKPQIQGMMSIDGS